MKVRVGKSSKKKSASTGWGLSWSPPGSFQGSLVLCPCCLLTGRVKHQWCDCCRDRQSSTTVFLLQLGKEGGDWAGRFPLCGVCFMGSREREADGRSGVSS